MAIVLRVDYSKKLGLPNYSSHQCSVSIQAEIADLNQITNEIRRLYSLAQDGVDREIVEVGFMPDATTYGMLPAGNGNGDGTPVESNRISGYRNGRGNVSTRADAGGAWACSQKQRDLIEKIVRENSLDKRDVDARAKAMFDGKSVRQLNRLEASGLIDELLEEYGGKRRGGSRGRFQQRERREEREPEEAR